MIAATWSLIALILARVHPLTWPILITAALAGAVRSAQPRDIRSASSAMASTPMGVIPLGLLALIARGYDTLLLPGLLVAVGLPIPAFITALAPLAYYLLRNRQT
ncbi:hypothetical protein GZ208_02130 [Dermatophilus congolensis]|nr:hypothetical protein [Dermatophilus congolensis]